MISLSSATLKYSNLSFADKSLKTLLIDRKRKTIYNQDIVAFEDLTLEIRNGERVAILGRNGAGKSSLLKAIAGVYPLSSGKIEVSGTIRSLFELNLGFELDATGRENIRYRSLLMGSHPNEIMEITKRVLDFSELGERIDFPIRTYSTGMLVKLAFSISTAFPGEILLLDEFISAGDISFIAKARNRLLKYIDSAEILVVATHDLSLAAEICNRAIVLHKGRMIFDGKPDSAIEIYRTMSDN